MEHTERIERYKAWCIKNYERGADTMVECWDTEDWQEFSESNPTLKKGMSVLKEVAAVYRDRQADAINSIF